MGVVVRELWEKPEGLPQRLVDMMVYQVGAPFVGHVDGISPKKMVAARLRKRKESEEEAAAARACG